MFEEAGSIFGPDKTDLVADFTTDTLACPECGATLSLSALKLESLTMRHDPFGALGQALVQWQEESEWTR